MEKHEFTEEIFYPSILFRLQNDYYAVSCRNVASIMQLQEVESLPEAPENVLGIFRFREKIIPIISLRSLFGLLSVEEEIQRMNEMLDARKQDHMNWVKELDYCTKQGTLFTLSKDAHQCALGRWYEQYKPENGMIKMQLQKLEEPHRKLHEAAVKLENCDTKEERQGILERVVKEYMPQVLEVLEGTKTVFQEHRRALLIVIERDDNSFALAVDEVLSVEELQDVAAKEEVEKLKGSTCITEIKKSPKLNRLVRLIEDEKLAAMAKNYHLE